MVISNSFILALIKQLTSIYTGILLNFKALGKLVRIFKDLMGHTFYC